MTPDNDRPMKIDPPPDPRAVAARKASRATCDVCACCRHWKAKARFIMGKKDRLVIQARKAAAYWKGQYETLTKARGRLP